MKIHAILTLPLLFLSLALSGCRGNSPENLLERGRERLEAGRYAAAARAYRRASRSITNSVPLYYNLGMACYKLENFAAAGEAFSAARRLDPTHFDTAEMLARTQTQQGQAETALRLLYPLSKGATAADRPRLLNALALAEIAASRPELALLHLQQAVRLNPNHAPTRYNLGRLLADDYKLFAEAIDEFELFVRLTAKDDTRLKAVQEQLLRLKAAAPAAGEPHQRAHQPLPVALRAIEEGDRHYRAGHWTQAEEAYARAFAADNRSPEAAIRLGHAMMGGKKYGAAAKIYERAVETAADNVEPAYMLALAHYQAGAQEQAATILTTLVIPRWPAHLASFQLMAYISAAQRKNSEALVYGEHYLELAQLEAGSDTREFRAWLDKLVLN